MGILFDGQSCAFYCGAKWCRFIGENIVGRIIGTSIKTKTDMETSKMIKKPGAATGFPM
ncbi:MAG: hypothetical protein ABH886_09570 [Candidatus Desantisbacteria bacterium]